MFIIKASTPETMRNEIVKWLNQQASNHRIAASKIAGMHKRDIEVTRATTYEGAAKFLENCIVDSLLCDHDGTFHSDCKGEACKSHRRCCWQ